MRYLRFLGEVDASEESMRHVVSGSLPKSERAHFCYEAGTVMQLIKALPIEKPSPTKNLHGRTPTPEVDEEDPFLVLDVREIEAREGAPDLTLDLSQRIQ